METSESRLEVTDVAQILQQWTMDNTKPEYEPIPTLEQLSTILQMEIDMYLRIDRNSDIEGLPSQSDQNLKIESILKSYFSTKDFMEKLINNYFCGVSQTCDHETGRNSRDLSDVANNLLEKILVYAGLVKLSVFQQDIDDLIRRLFHWAEKSVDPVQSYATIALITTMMEMDGTATRFEEENDKMVPFMLQKLHKIQEKDNEAGLSGSGTENETISGEREADVNDVEENSNSLIVSDDGKAVDSMLQSTILCYLSISGKNERFLNIFFEQNGLELVLKYLKMRETSDDELACSAVKYVASLMSHEKFMFEFFNNGGFQYLLDFPTVGEAATEVIKCFLCLANCKNLMEKICLLPEPIVKKLVKYALSILRGKEECARCYAIMFFGRAFPFKVILLEFDIQGGLKQFLDMVSDFPVSRRAEERTLNMYLYSNNIAISLKSYMEAHLYLRAEKFKNFGIGRKTYETSIPSHKSYIISPEGVQTRIEDSQINLVGGSSIWPVMEELYNLGGIALLFDIIDFVRLWSFTHHEYDLSTTETVVHCIDIMSICSAAPEVLVDPEGVLSIIRIPVDLLICAAEGNVVENPAVRRAALRAIVNYVCAPIYPPQGYNETAKRKKFDRKRSIENVWEIFRWNDGIKTLLKLINIKEPIADADGIRALACQAFVGLARSEAVRQIISQLPIFINGRFEALLEEPIHHEKQKEHAMFKEYALGLMKQASEETKNTVAKYRLFNIAAQTMNEQSADMNLTVRIVGRQLGINQNVNRDRKHIYSHFHPVQTFRSTCGKEKFTYCTFSACQKYLMVGTYSGEVAMFNIHSGIMEAKFPCHSNYIRSMECNRRGNLLLTSVGEPDGPGMPSPILWNTEPFFNKRLPIQNIICMDSMDYAEFSKRQDKIVATVRKNAIIYDITTGRTILTFIDNHPGSRYFRNIKATFSTYDEFLLSAGILWDPKSGKKIHKFDKLNAKSNGIFHPNGTDIISNTEIWDLRTFQLLKIMPVLDWMELQFSPVNRVIYATRIKCPIYSNYWTSFRTFDSSTYGKIGNHNVQRDVYDLACNKFDTQIAVVENSSDSGDSNHCCVQIYDVGRSREDKSTNENPLQDDDITYLW